MSVAPITVVTSSRIHVFPEFPEGRDFVNLVHCGLLGLCIASGAKWVLHKSLLNDYVKDCFGGPRSYSQHWPAPLLAALAVI